MADQDPEDEAQDTHTFKAKKGAINVCAHCGFGPNVDVHADRPAANEGAAAPAKRGRKKAPKTQRTIDDLVIEAPDLEEALDDFQKHAGAAKAYRDARHTIKTLIQTEYPDVVNAMTAEGKPRYVIAGNHRLLYQTAERPAAKSPAKAGVSTQFEIYQLI
jgi:electron transfer flavoprotein alpha subunit